MIVLTVNAGSSSVRLAAFASDGSELMCIGSERHETGIHQPVELLTAFVAQQVRERPQRVRNGRIHVVKGLNRLEAE